MAWVVGVFSVGPPLGVDPAGKMRLQTNKQTKKMYVRIYVCMYVCMYVCVLCVSVFVSVCLCMCMCCFTLLTHYLPVVEG